MNHELQSAGRYHAAMVDYAAAMRSGGDIETPAQSVIGASLRYRIAIDRLLEANDPESLAMVASRGRLERLRRTLASASRTYNLGKVTRAAIAPQDTAMRRPMSSRTA